MIGVFARGGDISDQPDQAIGRRRAQQTPSAAITTLSIRI